MFASMILQPYTAARLIFCFIFFIFTLHRFKLCIIMFPQISSVTYSTPENYQPPDAKDLASNVDYPNLNVTDMNTRLENVTPRLHNCYDSITMNEIKHFVLATNHRHGNAWWGTIYGYDQTDSITVDNADFTLQFEETVNIVRYSENNILLVALGDARLQAWSTYATVRKPNNSYCLFLMGEESAHNAPINQLCIYKTQPSKAVSTCLDNTLNVWDISGAELCSTYRASAAHSKKITGVATSSNCFSKILTCDRGGCSRLWDIRTISPLSTCLYNDDSHVLSFSSAAWANDAQGDNNIYLGDFDGNVHTLDLRVPGKLLRTDVYFTEGYTSQLLANGNHLAAMSNLPSEIKISDVNSGHKIIYSKRNIHTRQTDAVWRDDTTLVTIGYGSTLATHKI